MVLKTFLGKIPQPQSIFTGSNLTGEHKYIIGQELRFRGGTRGATSPGGYRVIGYRPPESGEPLYRIKSDLEPYERIARESELT